MGYNSWLKCVRGCGGLLDVAHDMEAWRDRSADEWKALFDQRTRSNEWPYGSGVWGKKEWGCPQVEVENVVSMYSDAIDRAIERPA